MQINTRVLLTEAEKAIQKGLRAVARETLRRSNQKAPDDPGTDGRDLKKSGSVSVDDLSAQVSYTARHALFQHERLDYQHPNGGEAKFLERAASEVSAGPGEQIMARAVREVFK